jgi:hypothetical protein
VVMVASASVAIAERRFGMELRYVLQQLVFLLGSLLIAVWVIQKNNAQLVERKSRIVVTHRYGVGDDDFGIGARNQWR